MVASSRTRRMAPPSNSLRILRPVLAQPYAQWDVVVGRGEVAVAVHAAAQDLPADRIAARPEVLDGHVVLGPDPAVAVAVEEDLARHLGPVRRCRVPEPAVEED